MFAAASFFGTFVDYLRPTKSPYLVVVLIAAGVLCLKVGSKSAAAGIDSLDNPGFFLPIFILIFAMVPLSLMHKAKTTVQDKTATVENAKYENDVEGVFKFSRALCLAVAAIMLFVHYKIPPADNLYSTLGYGIILAQLATFLSYMAFKHASVEDVSNIGLFQIAFITAVLFAASTYLATQIRGKEDTLQYFYYCKTQNLQFKGEDGFEQFKCNEQLPNDRGPIQAKTEFYRPDFIQISFAVLSSCWFVYELFWLGVLARMLFRNESVPLVEAPASTNAGAPNLSA